VGWIKLHKDILRWGWYKDSTTKAVFIHLLLTANYEPSELFGRRINRGQAVFGYRELANTLGVGVQQARTAIEHLKSTREITLEATRRFSVATICKYEDYQTCDADGNTRPNTQPNIELTQNQHTANTQVTPSKNIRIEEGKKKEKNIYGEFGNVRLSDEERGKLTKLMGDKGADAYIERMSAYLTDHPNKYKNHYATLLNWWRRDEDKRPKEQPTQTAYDGYRRIGT
jgi:hypothetical protein